MDRSPCLHLAFILPRSIIRGFFLNSRPPYKSSASTATSTAKRPRKYTLRPANRIKKRRDFLKLQDGGRKFRTRNFVFAFERRDDLPGALSQIGITVTRKVDKRAVARNRIKRISREMFRLNKPMFRWNIRLVVVALGGAAQLTREEQRRELLFFFEKVGLLSASRRPANPPPKAPPTPDPEDTP